MTEEASDGESFRDPMPKLEPSTTIKPEYSMLGCLAVGVMLRQFDLCAVREGCVPAVTRLPSVCHYCRRDVRLAGGLVSQDSEITSCLAQVKPIKSMPSSRGCLRPGNVNQVS